MAEEWIGMRVTLPGDPKVISMADFLARDEKFQRWLLGQAGISCRESAYEIVTRDVTVALCVTGLLRVWGIVNARGVTVGDALVLEHASLWTLDETAKIPRFGAAMAYVRWAVEDTAADVSRVRFPNFVEYNQPRKMRERELHRARQRRYRERQKLSQRDAPRDAERDEKVTPTVQYKTVQNSTGSAITADAQRIDRGVQGGKIFAAGGGPKKTCARNPAPEVAENSRASAGELFPQRKFLRLPVPPGFQDCLDEILSILEISDADRVLDQIGFLAKLAYADAAGFSWPPDSQGRPRVLWDFIGLARRKKNPAGWITAALREDLGPEGWSAFEQAYPSPGHCQWLLRELSAGRIHEGGQP